jgi:hypothetical protein
MFPNVRLMIVAISASILAVVCAMTLFMGMFAAFSFTHDSFSGLAAAKPPLQIAFADQVATPIVDGRPAPFGVRFRLNAPQIPSGPLIVPVPAPPDHATPAEAPPPEPVTNPAANAQADSPPDASSVVALSHDDTQAPQPSQEGPVTAGSDQAATHADDKASETKSDNGTSDDTTATIKAPAEPTVPERAAAPSPPPRVAPPIRIVSREADNPASVATSPAPSLAHKVLKRRKLAAHLRQSHHFRRPRIVRQPGAVQSYGQATGFAQPNTYGQPAISSYATGAYGQQGGFIQPGFGLTPAAVKLTPAAVKPRPAKWRRAVGSSTGNAASSSGNAASSPGHAASSSGSTTSQ